MGITRVAIAGSSGSIGTQTIEVVLAEPDKYRITALAVGSSSEAVIAQARLLKPELVVVTDETLRSVVAAALAGIPVTGNLADVVDVADVVINGVVGSVYFKKTGDTITPVAGTVGLALKTASGTSNLVEARSATNVLNFNLDKDGLPKVASAAVVYVGSSDHTALTTATAAAQAQADAAPFTPFLLAGL